MMINNSNTSSSNTSNKIIPKSSSLTVAEVESIFKNSKVTILLLRIIIY